MIFSKGVAPSTCSLPLPVSASSGDTLSGRSRRTSLRLQPRQHPQLQLGLPSIIAVKSSRRRQILHPLASTGTAQDNNGPAGTPEGTTTEPDTKGNPEESSQEQESESAAGQQAAADSKTEAIKEKLAAARAASSSGASDSGTGFWDGVVEEVGRIQWPQFGKVLGTTGVVIAVIAGSSVALLTVNAVLAELSDQVFAGRGVQDLFGG